MSNELETEEYSLDDEVGNKLKLICSHCKHRTNHTVLKSVTYIWATGGDDIQGSTDYLIVQCLGCEGLSYCTSSANSEDIDQYTGQPEIVLKQYPEVSIEHMAIRLPRSTPYEIDAAYEETSKALSIGLTTLGAVGIRMIIELICKSEGATGSNLEQMIEFLLAKGIISPSVADIVHGIRFIGNDAVHESKVSKSELKEAWQTVNMIITYIYGSIDSRRILLSKERAVKLEKSRAQKKAKTKKSTP